MLKQSCSISYFRTSVPGSGIFLPAHRAERRASPALSFDDFPGTPLTPSYASHRGGYAGLDEYAPPTPGLPKFSQSMGPGARPPSPQFKPKSRPSLPRPESPLRKQPTLAPTPARNFSMSQRGSAVPPRFAASPAPSRSATPKTAPLGRPPGPPRPYSRNNSRLGQRNDTILEKSTAGAYPLRSPSRQTFSNPDQEDEIRRLHAQLEEKDRQLNDQGDALADMDASLREIQAMIPSEEDSNDAEDAADVAQLRQALRDKNDHIQSLVSEFDAHRADFRSTIDTLEMASAETERVYEAKVTDLLAEIHELREIGHSREDVELVAQQLRGLEELVAELEEGLEDARRGEAEARGEVEFLRGEVERGRSELRREREKAAKALQGAKEVEGLQGRDKDVESKDDEIRGLKAIIHSLSSGPDMSSSPSHTPVPPSLSTNTEELEHSHAAVQQLEREKSELQGLVERKAFREEELERAIEQLRKAAQDERNSIANDDTVSATAFRRSKPRSPENTRLSPVRPGSKRSETLWCEVCESEGHDILTCDNMLGHHNDPSNRHAPVAGSDADEHDIESRVRDLDVSSRNGHDTENDSASPATDDAPSHTWDHETYGTQTAAGVTAAKEDDADKWCALCEKDGNLAYDCPEEL